ncbi:replication protein [Gracilibacillus alcaliphilus]|uniref:replication protein n=1 Tax=Gracilibacillus alcaliphilus TaxID=1401441 RepID=UPI00195AC8F4|nr:replication protein [Gracilibacillus alcaliphilus]MBM7678944.1 DnaD/phage-associated family protein [Gracilibacillus alcaliphilus]
MASPQTEKGYIRIANELWNEILRRDFSKRQQNLILFIWRLSYGTGQKDCVIDKFKHLELAGLYKSDVKKELKFLRDCSVLNWEEETMIFSINKDYKLWQITPNKNWDSDRFNDLIHLNLSRKKVSKTLTNDDKKVSNSLTPKNVKVSKTLTNRVKQVSKILTLKLVKYQLAPDSKSIVITNPASLKTLLKTLKIKDIKECSSIARDADFKEVVHYYESNLMSKGLTINEAVRDHIVQYFDEFGKELFLAAMKIAASQEKTGIRFVGGILNNWRKAGVKTLDDARLFEKQFKNSRYQNQRNYNTGTSKKDIVPDWYKKHKEEGQAQQANQEPSAEEKERLAREADELLAEYLKDREERLNN